MEPGWSAQAADLLGRFEVRDLEMETWVERAERLVYRAVSFDAAGWLMIDPATLLITQHWAQGRAHSFDAIVHNEYLENDVNKFADLARRQLKVATLSEATDGMLERSPRYRGVLRSNGIGHELRAALVYRGACWGALTIARELGQADFTASDVEAVARLVPILARALRDRVLRATRPLPGAEPPGVVLLDDQAGVISSTSTAARWLAEFTDVTDRPPAALVAVAAAARAQGTATLCVLGGRGNWLSLHGALLDGDRLGPVSIVVQRAEPEAMSRRVYAAHGLTARECEIADLVMAGRSTREISSVLFISANTVQDHLKAVFDKLGVRSRRDLVAQVLCRQEPRP